MRKMRGKKEKSSNASYRLEFGMNLIPNHPRGFLQNYPLDVVAVNFSGSVIVSITRKDILKNRRKRNIERLAKKRRFWNNEIKPCFIWVFNNGPVLPYGGWWLYIRGAKRHWEVRDKKLILQVMEIYPCGHLPIIESYSLWKPAFTAAYPRATKKRPIDQGMALARAIIAPGDCLVGIQKW